jgi:hypothetical protein
VTAPDLPIDVTVAVIAAREPEDRLMRMFQRIVAQQGAGNVEVLVAVPGGDSDTIERAAMNAGANVRVIVNPDGRRTTGLNLVLDAAAGAVFARVDARSLLPDGYLAAVAGRLEADHSVGVVGGLQIVATGGPAAGSDVVARALANPIALGAPAYRRRGATGPVDTVYLGAFRTEELRALGGFDERLDANEDFDVAARYRSGGSTVWLEDGLEVAYEPRDEIVGVLLQYWRFGQSKAQFWSLGKGRPNRRQMTALGAAAGFGILALARPRVGTAGLALAAVAAVAADHVAEPSERRPVIRLGASALSLGLVATWVAGVVVGALRSAWCRTSRRSAA